VAKLFPQLKDVAFETEWYGNIGMTVDHLPRFHRLGRNVVSFSGYNGRGIAPGTVFGRCLAQLTLGKVGEDDLPLPVSDARSLPQPTPVSPEICRHLRSGIGRCLDHSSIPFSHELMLPLR
jgi:L-pipecolate oxidase